MDEMFEVSNGDEMSLEQVIVSGFSENIKFLSRDEDGGLWATAKEPSVGKDYNMEEYLSYQLDDDIDGMHSLSAFNHIFNQIKPLDIVELNINGSE